MVEADSLISVVLVVPVEVLEAGVVDLAAEVVVSVAEDPLAAGNKNGQFYL